MATEEIKPIKLVSEFDGDRQDNLLSVEDILQHRDARDEDWLYINVFSGEDLISQKWLWIKGTDEIEIVEGGLKIDFYDLLVEEFELDNGVYDIEYCVKRKAVWPNEFVRVAEISKNKMEIRVDAPTSEKPLINLQRSRPPLLQGEYYAPLDIYTGNHKSVNPRKDIFVKAVAWAYDEYYKDETLVLKLAEKVDRSIKVGSEVEIWDTIVTEQAVTIDLVIEEPKGLEEYTELQGPMVTLDVNKEVGRPTEFEAWNDVLSATGSTNFRVENEILSGSGMAELNIDYRSFDNFVHFSSAKERVTNFLYKVSLIEYYESKSIAHSSGLQGQLSSSVTSSEAYVSLSADYTLKSEKIKGTFDGYEKYLYYKSSSNGTDDDTYYYSTSWPKQNSHTFGKPILYSYTSSEAQTWLTGSLDSASLYDINNQSLLRKTVPQAIRNDQNNSSFLLFVDMVAQHFDTLYNYIDNLKEQRNRDEKLTEGISKDLLFDTLKSFGWKPQSGLDLAKVWEYFIGTDSDGNYQTTSSAEYPSSAFGSGANINYVVTESMSKRDLELEPISRIVNNLPYIYKTKGTNRGLKALLNCYGIPSSFFKIQEFGGPDPLRSTSGSHRRELDTQNHAIKYGANPILTTSVDIDDATKRVGISTTENLTDARSIELRFKTTATHIVSQSLYAKNAGTSLGNGYNNIWIETSGSSEYGYITYNGYYNSGNSKYGKLTKLPVLDGDWWNVLIRFNSADNTVTLTCQKAPDHANGEITHKATTTITGFTGGAYQFLTNTFGGNDAYHTFGGTSRTSFTGLAQTNHITALSGSIQEVRFWSEELSDAAFDEHTRAATSYTPSDGNKAYDTLLYRLPLGSDNSINYNTSSFCHLSSSHPNQSITRAVAKVTGSWGWDEEDEVYYVQTPNSFGLRAVSNKIRIEDNSINGTLDPFKTQESSSSDTNPIDLPDLYVSVSPQDDLDVDIALQFGAIRMDNYIGDPRQKNHTYYPDLKVLRDDYFKKFSSAQTVQAYVRAIKYINSALFKQIDLMLPARGTNVVGMMIKPTLLERSKISSEPDFYIEEEQYLGKTGQALQNFEHYSQSIDCFNEHMMRKSDDYDAMLYTYDHDGTYAQQWFSTLTDTVRTEAGHLPNKYSFKIATKDAVTKEIRTKDFDGDDLKFTQDGVMPMVWDQRTSNKYYKTLYKYNSVESASANNWISSSFEVAQINQQDYFVGFYNSFVGGCKMTSQDFNIDSPDTIDGGPVVEFTEGNPNTLIAAEPSFKGDLDVR